MAPSATYNGGYVSFRDYGPKLSKFFEESDKGSLYGGFYQPPSALSTTSGKTLQDVYISKASRSALTVVNADLRMEQSQRNEAEVFASKLEASGIPTVRTSTQYHSKTFFSTVRQREVALIGSGNLSEDAINRGLPTFSRATRVNSFLLEAQAFMGNIIQANKVDRKGPERDLFQANLGVIIDNPRQVKELKKIYKDYANTGLAKSTDNFIVGGKKGRSSELISAFIDRGADKKQEIIVGSPYLDDPKIVESLSSAIKKGSKVTIISTNPNAVIFKATGGGEGHDKAIGKLMAAGALVYAPDRDEAFLPHFKGVGVGNEALLGSHNLTNKAADNSMEILYKAHGGVAQSFRKDFNSLIQQGFVHKLRANNNSKQVGRSYAIESAKGKAQEAGITNEQFAPLFDSSGELGYLLLPSKLGASYHYGMTLHNLLMRQAGHEGLVTQGGSMGIAESMWKVAQRADPNKAGDAVPNVVLKYDQELYQGGLGNALNEHWFMPQGWGRLYKDEVGLIPSMLGAFGAALDKSYMYYAAISPDMGETYKEGLDYGAFERKKGAFEAILEEGANFAIQTTAAVALYLAVGEPVAMLTGELFKSEADRMLNNAFTMDESPLHPGMKLSEMPLSVDKLARQFLGGNQMIASLGLDRALGGYSGDEMKLSFLNQLVDLKKKDVAYYDYSNFQLSAYHFNSVFFRRKAGQLLENTMKPFLIDYVNPFSRGSDKSKQFIDTIDELVGAIGKPVDIRMIYSDIGEKSIRSIERLDLDTVLRTMDTNNFELRSSTTDLDTGIHKGSTKVRKAEDVVEALNKQAIQHHEQLRGTEGQGGVVVRREKLESELARLERSNISIPGRDARITTAKTEILKLNMVETALEVEMQGTRSQYLKYIELEHEGVGAQRQQDVAMHLQNLLDVIPLNPFHWRMFGGVNDTDDYSRVGGVFSFEQASNYMKRMLFNQNAFRQIIDSSTVLEEAVDGAGNTRYVSTLKTRALTVKKVLDKGVGSIAGFFKGATGEAKQLHKMTKKFRKAESNLGYQRGIDWDDTTKSVAEIRSTGKGAVELFGVLSDYEDYMREIGGADADTLMNVNKRIMEMDLTRITERNIADKADDFLASQGKRKYGKWAAAAMFTLLVGNELFQSTGGASLTSQVLLAAKAAEDNIRLSVDFSGNRLFPTFNQDPFGIAETAGATGISLLVGYRIAQNMRGEGIFKYGMHELEMDEYLKQNPHWSLKEVEEVDIHNGQLRHTTVERGEKGSGKYGVYHLINEVDGKRITLYQKYAGQVLGNVDEAMEGILPNVGKNTYRYISNPVIQAVNDRVGLTTFVLASAGLLAYSGFRKAAAALANNQRDSVGSLDPVVAGTIATLGIGLATRSPTLGLIAGMVAAGGATLINMMGLKFFRIGGAGDALDPKAQTAAQLSEFHAVIKGRSDRGEASQAELIAGFYAGEISKYQNIYKTEGGDRQVQVVARQVPLPFLQFFLAESKKGQRFYQGRLMDDTGTSYYSLGVQASPLTGLSYTMQLPIKFSPGTGIFGFSHNEESNLVDVMYGMAYMSATTSLGLGVAKGSSQTAAKVFRSLSKNVFQGKWAGLDEAAEGLEDVSRVLSGVDQVRKGIGRTAGAMFNIAMNVVRQLPFAELVQYRDTLDRNTSQSVVEAQRIAADGAPNASLRAASKVKLRAFGRGVTGFFIGSTVGSLAYQMFMKTQGLPQDELAHQGFATASGIAGSVIYSGSTFASAALSNKMSPLVNPLIDNYRRLPRKATRYGALGLAIAAFSYALTDSSFGVGVGFDQKYKLDKTGQPHQLPDGRYEYEADYNQRFMTMGAFTGITVAYLGLVAKVGLNPAETLRAYEKVLVRRTSGKGQWNPWTRWSDAQIEKDAVRVIDTVANKFNHVKGSAVTEMVEGVEIVAARGIAQDLNVRANLDAIPDPSYYSVVQKKLAGNLGMANAVKGAPIPDTTIRFGQIVPVSAVRNPDRGFINLVENSNVLQKAAKSALRGQRMWRALWPLAVVEAIVFTQLNQGGETNRYVEGILAAGDSGNMLQRVAADTLRLITRRDIIDPQQMSGMDMGRGDTVRLKGRKLLDPKDENFKGTQRAWSDIKEIFVFDEPNAFFSLGVGGMSFRPGDEGVRGSYYFQLQSAGQDVSTSVYSMATKFAFVSMAQGGIKEQLLYKWATQVFSGKGEHGQSKTYSQNDINLAAMRILNVSAMGDHLQKRRKMSRVNDEVLELAGGDSLLSLMVKDREELQAHMSQQPPSSLIANMLRESVNPRRKDLSYQLTQAMKGDKQAIANLFKDTFGNKSRNRTLKNVRFFSYDYKAKQMAGQQVFAQDESQWSSSASWATSTYNKEQEKNNFGVFSYLSQIAPPGTPEILKNAIAFAAGSLVVGGGITWMAHAGLAQETDVLMHNNTKFFEEQMFSKTLGSGALIDPQAQFKVTELTGPDGTEVRIHSSPNDPALDPNRPAAVSADPTRPTPVPESPKFAVVKKGSSIFHISSIAVTGDDTRQAVQGQLARLSQSFDRILGGDGGESKSFIGTIRSETFQGELKVSAEAAHASHGSTTYRAQLIENLTDTYMKQVDETLDKMFGVVDPNGSIEAGKAGAIRDPNLHVSITTSAGKQNVELYKLLFPDWTPSTPPAEVNKWIMDRKAAIRKSIVDSLAGSLEGAVKNEKALSALPNQITDLFVKGKIESHLRRTSEVVLQGWTRSSGFNLIRTSYGVLESLGDRPANIMGRIVERYVNAFKEAGEGVTKAFSKPVSESLPPNPAAARNPTPDPTVRLPGAVPEVDIPVSPRGSSSPIIPNQEFQGGRLPLWKGVFRALSLYGLAVDTLSALDIFAGSAKLAKAYVDPYTTTEGLKQAKREYGYVLMKQSFWGLGVGSVSAVVMSFGASLGLAVGLGSLLAVAGVGALAYVGYKTLIEPSMARSGVSPFAGVGKVVNQMWEGAGDLAGEIFGGWIPEIGGMVAGDRGRAAITTAVGGSIAGVMFGVGLWLSGLALGMTSFAALMPIIAAGALAGLVVGATFPSQFGDMAVNLRRSISNIPFIGGLVTNDKEILAQKRFQHQMGGNVIYFGTATEAIQEEYTKQLQAASDYSGQSTARLFVASSLYGGHGPGESVFRETASSAPGGAATPGAARPPVFADQTIGRELAIKGQLFNQTVVGAYSWRVALNNAVNKNQVLLMQKKWNDKRAEAIAATILKESNKFSSPTEALTPPSRESQEALQGLPIVNKLLESQMGEAEKVTKTQVTVSIPKENLKSPSADQMKFHSMKTVGVDPVTDHGAKAVTKKDATGKSVSLSKEPLPINNLHPFAKKGENKISNNPNNVARGLVTH